MRKLIVVLGLALLATNLAAQDGKRVWNFDMDKTGTIAAGFMNAVGEWKVVADPTAPSRPNVLA